MRYLLLLAMLCVTSASFGDDDDDNRQSRRNRRSCQSCPSIPQNVYWRTWTEGNRTYYAWSTSPIPQCACSPTQPQSTQVAKPVVAPVDPVVTPEPIAQVPLEPVEPIEQPAPLPIEDLTPDAPTIIKPKLRSGLDKLLPPMAPTLELLSDPASTN